MVIGIFGENCTGKSKLAHIISENICCEIFSGKDYLRLAKNEGIAREMFKKRLLDAVTGENIIYVISETEHLSLLPEGCLRILVTANIELIKSRFAQRMNGNLPAPVAAMLEKKHGCFENYYHDIHVNENTDFQQILKEIIL